MGWNPVPSKTVNLYFGIITAKEINKMSKESYARGFVKKAQECGVNPNDLIDFIKQSAGQNALDEGVREAMKDIADYAEKHPIGTGALAGGLSSVASGAQAGRALGGLVGGVAGSALAPVGALVGGIAGSSTDAGSGAGSAAGAAGTVAGGSAVGGAIGAVPGAIAGSALAPVGSGVGASAGSAGATQKFKEMVERERSNIQMDQQIRRKVKKYGPDSPEHIEQMKRWREERDQKRDKFWNDLRTRALKDLAKVKTNAPAKPVAPTPAPSSKTNPRLFPFLKDVIKRNRRVSPLEYPERNGRVSPLEFKGTGPGLLQ